MLGKLFKHDFASIGRVTLPVLIGLTIASLIGKLFIFISSRKVFVESASLSFYKIIGSLSTLFQVLCVMAIFVCFNGLFIYIIYRFYQSIYTDEGYLTLTLPVKSTQIVFSKLVTAIIWRIITYIVTVFDLFLVLRKDNRDYSLVQLKDDIFRNIHETALGMDVSYGLLITQIIILILLTFSTQFLLGYASITVGSSTIPKHKVLGTILFFLIFWVVMFILGLLQFYFLSGYLPEKIESIDNIFKATQATLITVTITNFIYSLIFFFTSSHLIKTKVNLD